MRVVLYARHGTASFEAVAVACGTDHEVIWQRPSVFHPADTVPGAGVAIVDGHVGNADAIRAAYETASVEVLAVEDAPFESLGGAVTHTKTTHTKRKS